MPGASAVLLLPNKLQGFIQYDQAVDLLRSPGITAIEQRGVPYGAYLRIGDTAAQRLAAAQARTISLPEDLRALVMFHPVQLPLAEALLARRKGAELMYLIWDRYEFAYDAAPAVRERLATLHARAARRAEVVVTVSEALAELERAAHRRVDGVSPSAADSFPAMSPASGVVAVSLGHLGWRVDWRLVRSLCERMGDELTLLLVGKVAEDQLKDNADYRACRTRPEIVWLGFQPDAAAARVIGASDVAVLPFEVSEFNDAGIPNRVLKAARQGRKTIVPPLQGPQTWPEAVVVAEGVDDWVEALRSAHGTRACDDPELQRWAIEDESAERSNAPLWKRLRELGVPGPE